MFGENVLAWLYLCTKSGIKNNKLRELYRTFGSAVSIISASFDDLHDTRIVDKNQIAAIKKYSPESLENDINYLEANNIGIMTIECDIYPDMLRSIGDPPLLLYYKGRLLDLDKYLCVACIGSRTPTSYGKKHAYSIAYGMAKKGCIIVSGLALGIDAISHRAALDAGMPTVAFVANGLDMVYPASNTELCREIEKTGMVISEYPPGYAPLRYNFPERNRLISGLSKGVFISEASLKSGSSLTCSAAVVQGRDLFALPGNVDSAKSGAPNNFIKSGAYVVLSADDIVNHYYGLYSQNMKLALNDASNYNNSTKMQDEKDAISVPSDTAVNIAPAEQNIKSDLDVPDTLSDEDKVLFVLKEEILPIDVIAHYTKISLSQLDMIMLMLEMDGRIKNDNGNYYIVKK